MLGCAARSSPGACCATPTFAHTGPRDFVREDQPAVALIGRPPGPAEAILMALAGRRSALDELDGDGRDQLAAPTRVEA